MGERFQINPDTVDPELRRRFPELFKSNQQLDVVGNFPVPATGSISGTIFSKLISDSYYKLQDWGAALKKQLSQFKFHGRWGGPLYSAGKYYQPDQIITREDILNNPPTDELDNLFYKHDLRYQLAATADDETTRSEGLKAADAIFLEEVSQILNSPTLPRDVRQAAMAAQAAFKLKLWSGIGYSNVEKISEEGRRIAEDYLAEDLDSLLARQPYIPDPDAEVLEIGEGTVQSDDQLDQDLSEKIGAEIEPDQGPPTAASATPVGVPYGTSFSDAFPAPAATSTVNNTGAVFTPTDYKNMAAALLSMRNPYS